MDAVAVGRLDAYTGVADPGPSPAPTLTTTRPQAKVGSIMTDGRERRSLPRHLLEHSHVGAVCSTWEAPRPLPCSRGAAGNASPCGTGQAGAAHRSPSRRIVLVLTQALGQARILSQAYPGVMHAIVFWGFLALFMGTVLATIDYDITLPLLDVKLLKGTFYLVYELVLDMFGLFFVVGLGMALLAPLRARPRRMDPTPQFA